MRKILPRLLFSSLFVLGAQALLPAATQAAANQQFFPLATYRVGAYASSGIPVWAGMIDYLRYINEVEGGINGVKLVWQECETEWTAEKGIECYERFKNGLDGAPVAIYSPNGAPAAYALADKAEADKIPLITLGYGRTEATDGRVFPYNFPVMLTFYSEASAFINYVAEREGGFDKLKGKKIATVYHDSAYGRETQGPLALLAQKYGFENIQIPVADPGNEQAAQWRQVRQVKPDWVFLRTWGVSTPVAIKTAARFGFPVDRIVGDIWASSNEDVLPAGEAGKGYLALTPYPGGAEFDIHRRIRQYILDTGKSDLKDPKSFGSVYYNSGLVNAAIAVEAIRTGQKKFGNRPLNGEEGRWGLEHLDLNDARLKEIGYLGLMQPLKLSCSDHEGGGAAKVQQWDGQQWKLITDWVQADRATLRPLIDAKAAEYAKEKGVTARDCAAQ
ncbi:putative branched-chain amino acid ABC transporter, periplasmic branched-chain amino acid-binding protein [Pseudomonas fluorescens Q2-87]|uniref:Putative branched-chain amino acid ABC transporter, periplasmic branched-chain amino acid-binding protein n=1 Tax=Pseudomonas fluorescens (strain Q2-87) TaxID=1038922 RepID=J2F1T4_PSEFQ|nr:ABC transporter substrate-binding protein [Pseudomonas fluorescens]EJL02928.1 putative branched-chain amino acid ABC transporter, periplasmic branched-chain amino acid-binding protein [Pseudomonas fluorescens Q2-87]